jgi:hypothetical protein
MSNEVKIAVLETQVERLLEKQKELTERVRANEKVVAAIGLLGSIAVAFIGAGYFAPKAEAYILRMPYVEMNDGSDGSTKSEELLQFPSN